MLTHGSHPSTAIISLFRDTLVALPTDDGLQSISERWRSIYERLASKSDGSPSAESGLKIVANNVQLIAAQMLELEESLQREMSQLTDKLGDMLIGPQSKAPVVPPADKIREPAK